MYATVRIFEWFSWQFRFLATILKIHISPVAFILSTKHHQPTTLCIHFAHISIINCLPHIRDNSTEAWINIIRWEVQSTVIMLPIAESDTGHQPPSSKSYPFDLLSLFLSWSLLCPLPPRRAFHSRRYGNVSFCDAHKYTAFRSEMKLAKWTPHSPALCPHGKLFHNQHWHLAKRKLSSAIALH